MKNNWTDEQQQAINARNVSVIVSAAAGSGKTSVLVERLIKIISDTENKIPVNEMIIVTFTNDATAEMKHRLSEKLSEMIMQNPDNEWLIKQNSLLQCAKIATIHSFCFDLIRDNIQNTDIASGFRIIDSNEEKIIIKNSIEEVIENAYSDMPDKMNLLYKYFCDSNDYPIEKMLLKIYEYMESIPYSEQWLKSLLENFQNPDFKNNIINEYKKQLEKLIKKAQNQAYRALKIADKYNDLSKEATNALKVLENDYVKISDVISDLQNNPQILYNKSKLKFDTLRIKNAPFPDNAIETIKALREQYKNIYNTFFNKKLDILINAERDINAHIEIYKIIEKLISDLNQKITQIKIQKNGIGFSDAEKIAIKLLSETDADGNIKKSKLAEELSDYYKIIMVDEFQDTNNNQNLIFKLLSHNGTADENGDNLFLVGDVKQAIYGFRLANPKIFSDILANSAKYSENCNENAYIKLNKNFRSSKEVIEFVNYIFSKIMNTETGNIDYNDDEKLIQGASFADTDKITEVVITEKNSDLNMNAVWTAKKIAEMLKNKAPVCNPDGKTTRPCENKDFCILLRNNKNMPEYAEELRKYNIPCHIEETEGYIQSREISLMINLLKIIDNPLIDTALTAVMLSPMFSMTPDEVTEIRLVNNKVNMYTALCMAIGKMKIPSEDNVTDEIIFSETEPLIHGSAFNKALNLFQIITELRMYSATDTLEQLIRRIYERTDFLSVMQIYKDGERKKANLRILIEYAKNYESSSDGGLSGFLRFVEKSNSFKHGKISSGSENAVHIKNIHKSKGLEFSFVFIGDLEKQFNKNDLKESFIIDSEYGIGFQLQNPDELIKYSTVPFKIIHDKKLQNLINEELRLLYVALTRAKEKLFLVFTIDNKEKKKEKIELFSKSIEENNGITSELISECESMHEFIILALMASKYSAYLCEKFKIHHSFAYDDEFPVKFTEFKIDDIEIPKENENAVNESEKITDMKYINAIENSFRYFNNEYNFELSELPAKLSVSEISKNNAEFDTTLKRPKFIKNLKKLTPAEIGTATHTFMQYADFENMQNNVENELDVCVSKGFITQKERENIKSDKIQQFISSDIFRRIQNSKNVQRERKFMINIKDLAENNIISPEYQNKDIILQGIADIIFEENNELVIIDYKTDYAVSESELTEKYSSQLMIYKLAFEKIENKKVKECIIYSFSLGQSISIDLEY